MLKIRPESLTTAEMLRSADHEVACGNSLPLAWQMALVQIAYKLQDELAATA
jgi:hypothetical protein